MNRLFACVLVSGIGFVGCIDSDGTDLSATEQDVSVGLGFNACGSGPCAIDIPLAPTASNVCFLTGVGGDLTDASGSIPAGAWIDTKNKVGVVTNSWWLHVASPSGNSIGAGTACIPATSYQTASVYAPNASATITGTATTRCFLSGVENFNFQLAFADFDHSNAFIEHKPFGRGVQQILHAFFPVGANVRMDMVCTDIPTFMGDWSYGNGVAQPTSFNLASNSGGGVACGLTGLGGQFSTKDFNNGVEIQFSSGTNFWGVIMSGWKGMHAECVK